MIELNKKIKYVTVLSLSLILGTIAISDANSTNEETLSNEIPNKQNINIDLSNQTNLTQSYEEPLDQAILTQNSDGHLDVPIEPFTNKTSTMENGTIMVDIGKEVPITFEQKGPFQILDEDLILTPLVEVRAGGEKATIDKFTKTSPWRSGIIPVVLESDFPNKQRIYDALSHIQSKTPLLFKAATGTEPYYMRIIASPEASDCFTYAGMLPRDAPLFTGYTDQNGEYHLPFYKDGKYHGQPLVLGSNCSAGNIIHEFGHTAGLHHEQKRCDRDKYVTIIWTNIPKIKWSQYETDCIAGTSQSLEGYGNYDYCSIMHYPQGNPEKIHPKQQVVGCELGQRDGYSPIDMAAIKSVYPFE